MESKVSLTDNRLPALLLALILLNCIAGCASQPTTTEPEAPLEDAVQPPPADEDILPRQAAARELTTRGRRHLADSRPDAAIRELERALNLDPANGKICYYLAEAWLMKIDARRAGEFNRMAENLFKDNPDWLVRIARQADRIAELEQ